jgi:hypothetical protein
MEIKRCNIKDYLYDNYYTINRYFIANKKLNIIFIFSNKTKPLKEIYT